VLRRELSRNGQRRFVHRELHAPDVHAHVAMETLRERIDRMRERP
jgi:hypothetical protein